MAKRVKLVLGSGGPAAKDESEVRWLISYSDFMMQLVCLFILLYSVSSLDKEKMSLVAAYYRASIGRGEAPVHEPASKGKNLAVGDRPLVSATGGRADIPPSVRYTIEQVPGGWIARFQEAAFAPGSSTLSPEVASDLDTIAARLRSYAGSVFVTATAAAGPADASDGDALRLAAARAEAATSRLTREGSLDARFVQATGKATPAEEARRLEILVRVK